MNHQPRAGGGHHPFTALSLREINRLGGTKTDTDTTSLAADRVYPVCCTIGTNCVKAADIEANSARSALTLVDYRLVTTEKEVSLHHLRRQQKMEIGCIDVTVDQYRVICQNGK
jgi:hypothetical protein